MAGSAADRKRTRQAKAAARGRSRRRSPKDAGAGSRGRGGGRSRAPIGASRCEAGFHETTHGGDDRLFGAWRSRRTGEGRGNRPVERAGRETARGFGSRPRPERVPDEASVSGGVRDSGKAFGRRRDPKGDRRGLGPDANLEKARLRPGRIRQRDAAAGLRPRSCDPTGIGEGPNQPLRRDPPGPERGFAASLRDPGKAAGAQAPPRSRSRPARDGLATQRRQSRLGQVGAGGDTGPHYPFRRHRRPASAYPESFLGPQAQSFLREGHEARSGPRRRARNRVP